MNGTAPPAPPPPDGVTVDERVGRRSGLAIAVASAVAALSNFVILFVAARTLSVDDNNEFLVFWSLLFGMFGVVSGVQHETTRTVGVVCRGTPSRDLRASGRTRVIWASLAIGGMVALALVALGPWLASRIVPISSPGAVIVLVATAVAYSAHVTAVGSLAGAAAWNLYAGIIVAEVGARMVLVSLAAAATLGILGYEVASASAILVSAAFVALSRRARTAFSSWADGTFTRIVRNMGFAVLSTSCTALLVTGYPAVLAATNPAGTTAAAAVAGGLVLTVSLTRAPIMMPLTAFQGVAIRTFLGRRDSPLEALRKPAVYLLLLGTLGGAAAWVVGPPFLQLFKAEYQVEGWVFGILTLSSAGMAILTLLGVLALAVDRHVLYASGWITASLAAIALLLLPLDLTSKVVLSLAVSPLVGSLVIALPLARTPSTTFARVGGDRSP